MSGRYKIRWFVYIISIAAAICLCLFLNDVRQEPEEAEREETEGTQGLSVLAYAADGEKCCEIVPWYAAGEEVWLLFLPDWAASLSFSEDILLNGQMLEKGEKVEAGADRNYGNMSAFEVDCGGEPLHMEAVELSRLPALFIDTATGNLESLKQDKKNEEEIMLSAFDMTGEGETKASGRMHCRGNVTFEMAEKKSYTLEFAQSVDFYGMGAAGKWILLSNVFDSTSIRNYLTFYMAERMNLYGTPEAQWVDLFANGEYQGIYLLCEKVEIGEERLDIRDQDRISAEQNDLEAVKKSAFYVISDNGQEVVSKGFRLEKEPEDISGGYLLELEAMPERYAEGKSGFISDQGQRVVIESPKYASPSQVSYISGLYQKLEDTLYSGDETQKEAFLEYMDLDSITGKYLIEEFSKNVDASMSSCFLYKPEDAVSTKLYAGPVWDYDRAYGNMSNLGEGLDMRTPEDLYVRDGYYGTPFWLYFCLNPVFEENVRKVYKEEMLPLIEECVQEKIPLWEEQIRASVYADLRRWPDKEEEVRDFQGLSYEEKVDRLKEFMTVRAAWLKQEWGVDSDG